MAVEGGTTGGTTTATGAERRRTVVGIGSGNAMEWFDWNVYATFSAFFAPQFFPGGEPGSALLKTLAVFAVGSRRAIPAARAARSTTPTWWPARSVPGRRSPPGRCAAARTIRDPRSPHYDDHLQMWADGEAFPLAYTREAVLAAAESRLVPPPAGREDRLASDG